MKPAIQFEDCLRVLGGNAGAGESSLRNFLVSQPDNRTCSCSRECRTAVNTLREEQSPSSHVENGAQESEIGAVVGKALDSL